MTSREHILVHRGDFEKFVEEGALSEFGQGAAAGDGKLETPTKVKGKGKVTGKKQGKVTVKGKGKAKEIPPMVRDYDWLQAVSHRRNKIQTLLKMTHYFVRTVHVLKGHPVPVDGAWIHEANQLFNSDVGRVFRNVSGDDEPHTLQLNKNRKVSRRFLATSLYNLSFSVNNQPADHALLLSVTDSNLTHCTQHCTHCTHLHSSSGPCRGSSGSVADSPPA
jgi:hypothetical protein